MGSPEFRSLSKYDPLHGKILTQTIGDETTEYVPREMFEALLVEKNEYRRALALVNVAYRLGVETEAADRHLDALRETFAQAQATYGLIGSARGTVRARDVAEEPA